MESLDLSALTNEKIQEYIFLHENEDEKKLVLSQKEVSGIPSSVIATQIAGRKKAKHKISLWYQTKGIVYPPSLNLEQSSSEATAKFKTSLIEKGAAGVDLTGGFGIDSFFLSQVFTKFYYVEPDESLLHIARHNHSLLGASNIDHVNLNAEDFIAKTKENFDLIFIDPSRRNKQQKVFKLSDCVPDVSLLLPALLSKSQKIIIKASPLLDIQQGLRELQNVSQIFVVSVGNEVKEVLFLIEKNFKERAKINAIELSDIGEVINHFSFYAEDEKEIQITFSAPLQYLYEPNASILKAGAFKSISTQYDLKKLHPSSHLYTSEKIVDVFPGRLFKIIERPKLDKNLKDYFPNGYANIISRNYPLNVEEIKKRTGLKEGGELFLICTQSEKEKLALIAERLK